MDRVDSHPNGKALGLSIVVVAVVFGAWVALFMNDSVDPSDLAISFGFGFGFGFGGGLMLPPIWITGYLVGRAVSRSGRPTHTRSARSGARNRSMVRRTRSSTGLWLAPITAAAIGLLWLWNFATSGGGDPCRDEVAVVSGQCEPYRDVGGVGSPRSLARDRESRRRDAARPRARGLLPLQSPGPGRCL